MVFCAIHPSTMLFVPFNLLLKSESHPVCMSGHLIIFVSLISGHVLNVVEPSGGGRKCLRALRGVTRRCGVGGRGARDLITYPEGHDVWEGRVGPCDQLLLRLCWHVCLISLILSSAPGDTAGAVAKPPRSPADQGCRRVDPLLFAFQHHDEGS